MLGMFGKVPVEPAAEGTIATLHQQRTTADAAPCQIGQWAVKVERRVRQTLKDLQVVFVGSVWQPHCFGVADSVLSELR